MSEVPNRTNLCGSCCPDCLLVMVAVVLSFQSPKVFAATSFSDLIKADMDSRAGGCVHYSI